MQRPHKDREQHQVLFRREYCRSKGGENWELSWVRVPVNMLSLLMIFPYDIQRYETNNRVIDKLSGDKDSCDT